MKKFYRNDNDVFISGTLSGMSEYFGLDTTWLRLIYSVLMLFTPLGAILFVSYFLMWIFSTSK